MAKWRIKIIPETRDTYASYKVQKRYLGFIWITKKTRSSMSNAQESLDELRFPIINGPATYWYPPDPIRLDISDLTQLNAPDPDDNDDWGPLMDDPRTPRSDHLA